MKELFDRVKAHSIAKTILRYALGVLFIILGIVLGYLYGVLWLLVGIVLCMAESVILILATIKRNSNKERLINETYSKYMPEFKPVTRSTGISNAFKILDLNQIAYSFETSLTYRGVVGETEISHASIKCRVNGCGLDDYFIRIYAFKFKKPIEADLNTLKNKYLINYRFETDGNKLHLVTIARGGRGRLLSMNPVYFKNYEQWILRIEDENIFIHDICKLIGGEQ